MHWNKCLWLLSLRPIHLMLNWQHNNWLQPHTQGFTQLVVTNVIGHFYNSLSTRSGSNPLGWGALVHIDGFTRNAIHECGEASPRFPWKKNCYNNTRKIRRNLFRLHRWGSIKWGIKAPYLSLFASLDCDKKIYNHKGSQNVKSVSIFRFHAT